jgi:hypothetical protein
MVRCDGKRAGFQLVCNGSLYRCVCGHVGCAQTRDDACSKQGFTVLGKCLACGETGKRELVAPEAVGYRQTLMHDGVGH